MSASEDGDLPDLQMLIGQLGENEHRALAWIARYMLTGKQRGEPPPLRTLLVDLTGRKRAVLTLCAERLLIGFRQYGPLPLERGGTTRDWKRELRFELLDAVSYTAFDALTSGVRTRRARVRAADILDVAISEIGRGVKVSHPATASP